MGIKSLRNFTVLSAVAVTMALPNFAMAQSALPTQAEVGILLDQGCATTPNGELLDEAACLSAIATAVSVAEQYFALGGEANVPPQLDIGGYLCALGIRIPGVNDAIIEAILDSYNLNLTTGCQDAIDAVTFDAPPKPRSTN